MMSAANLAFWISITTCFSSPVEVFIKAEKSSRYTVKVRFSGATAVSWGRRSRESISCSRIVESIKVAISLFCIRYLNTTS